MRYIRTKDGKIYDTSKCASINYPFNPDFGIVWEFEGCAVNEDEVIKEADTIEKLCDKFIGVEENGTPHIFAYECDLLDLIHNAERKFGIKVTGYGAIWTDKGLIYVAKMNPKGEMELL